MEIAQQRNIKLFLHDAGLNQKASGIFENWKENYEFLTLETLRELNDDDLKQYACLICKGNIIYKHQFIYAVNKIKLNAKKIIKNENITKKNTNIVNLCSDSEDESPSNDCNVVARNKIIKEIHHSVIDGENITNNNISNVSNIKIIDNHTKEQSIISLASLPPLNLPCLNGCNKCSKFNNSNSSKDHSLNLCCDCDQYSPFRIESNNIVNNCITNDKSRNISQDNINHETLSFRSVNQSPVLGDMSEVSLQVNDIKNNRNISRPKSFTNPIKPFVCPYNNCNKRFTRNNNVTKHIDQVHKMKRISCPYATCFRTFASKNSLNTHKRFHHEKKKIKCRVPGCNQSFNSYYKKQNHENDVHLGWKCTDLQCALTFVTKTQRDEHIQLIHDFCTLDENATKDNDYKNKPIKRMFQEIDGNNHQEVISKKMKLIKNGKENN